MGNAHSHGLHSWGQTDMRNILYHGLPNCGPMDSVGECCHGRDAYICAIALFRFRFIASSVFISSHAGQTSECTVEHSSIPIALLWALALVLLWARSLLDSRLMPHPILDEHFLPDGRRQLIERARRARLGRRLGRHFLLDVDQKRHDCHVHAPQPYHRGR